MGGRAILCPVHQGHESGTVVPLLTNAASAPWHSSHAGTGMLCTESFPTCLLGPRVFKCSLGWKPFPLGPRMPLSVQRTFRDDVPHPSQTGRRLLAGHRPVTSGSSGIHLHSSRECMASLPGGIVLLVGRGGRLGVPKGVRPAT